MKEPLQYPPKSGIRIYTVTNATGVKDINRETFGESFVVAVPARITGNGRLRRQFGKLDDAKAWAANQLHTGRKLGSAFHRLTEREQRLCAEAVELLRPKGISILKAAQFALERLAPEICTKTAKDVAAELRATRQSAGASKRYLEDLKARLTRFADKFDCPLAHVTAKEISDWLASLGLSAQSVVNFRRVIVTLFEFAKDRDYIPRNFDEHERVKVAKVSGGDVTMFNAEEVARLLGAASPEFLPCLAVSAFGGLRSQEVERLTWDEVRLPERIIELKSAKTKTRARRIVPVNDSLAAWLAPYAKETGLLWKGTHREFYREQQRTARAAGIEWKQNALRHAYISNRLALVKNAAQVSLEAGNSASTVFKHYHQATREDDARTYFAILPSAPSNITTIRKAV